jgi:hypothetical protein
MTHDSRWHRFLKFEHRRQPLLSTRSFARRMVVAAIASLLLLAVWTFVGMWGYHALAGLGWVDAFLNSAMIVGGMGPVDVLKSDSAKIFAGLYAILSGVAFLSVFGLLFLPIFHRFLHRFHLESIEPSDSERAVNLSKTPTE